MKNIGIVFIFPENIQINRMESSFPQSQNYKA